MVVHMAQVTWASVKTLLKLNNRYRFWCNICCHQDNSFFSQGLIYFSKTMPNTFCTYNSSMTPYWKSLAAKRVYLWSRPVNHWQLEDYKAKNMTMKAPKCWAPEILYQGKLERNVACEAEVHGLVKSQMLAESDATQWHTHPCPFFMFIMIIQHIIQIITFSLWTYRF